MYDVAIIGTGPAGLSAALTLKVRNKKIIWFGSAELSGKVEKSEKIANYPGTSMVNGGELNRKFKQQIEEAGLEITDRMVTNIMATRKCFMVLGGNEIYEARTVLLAGGVASVKGFEGEQRLLGHGVSYCATCDGFLYKGKKIAVFCGDRRFEGEVNYLAELAETVYVFAPYKEHGFTKANIQVFTSGIREILGEQTVTGCRLADNTELSVSGVFIIRNAVAPATLMNGLAMEGAHIIVDRSMATNKKGCFAAGDCTGRPYQLTKAVGEGNIAAHSILEYLDEET